MEAVYDGHQRGLVQVAADACGRPWLKTVGGEADSDADVSGGVLGADIERGDGESAESHLRELGYQWSSSARIAFVSASTGPAPSARVVRTVPSPMTSVMKA